MEHRRMIGYARVSTTDQSLELQIQALEAHGCARIFCDNGVSGALDSRAGLSDALSVLSSGDVFVVWKLDRLGRSLSHLVLLIEKFGREGVGFISLTEAIDTTNPAGRLVFHLLAALAEFERALISERTRAGMAAARRKGTHMGRPQRLTPQQIEEVHAIIARDSDSRSAVARRFGISLSTLRRILRGRTPPDG